jgi:hypothetical protein
MARRKCPECGSNSVARLVYGYIIMDEEFLKTLDSGKVAMGGCTIEEDMPYLRCNDCWHSW